MCLTIDLITSGSLLLVNGPSNSFPIKFSCRWTKGSTEDKARVDYQYTSEGIQSDVTTSPPPPPHTSGKILTLPVERGAGKVYSNGAIRCMVSVLGSEHLSSGSTVQSNS